MRRKKWLTPDDVEQAQTRLIEAKQSGSSAEKQAAVNHVVAVRAAFREQEAKGLTNYDFFWKRRWDRQPSDPNPFPQIRLWRW